MPNEREIIYGKRKDLGVETAPIGTTERCEALAKRLEEAEALMQGAVAGFQILLNFCKIKNLSGAQQITETWINEFQTFLARQPKTGDIWVSESLQGRIYRITQEGEIIGFMDNRDSELGVLIMPKDIAPGKEGELLVIDGMLGSLQSFDENGNLVAVYYTPELEYLELPSIVAVAYDPTTGDIYVSSKIESAIFRLQLIQ